MKQTLKDRDGQNLSTKQIYSEIDELPLYNFKKVIDTKDLTFLKKTDESKATDEELTKAWNRISEQVAEVTGVGDVQQKFIMLQTDIETLTIDYLVTRDRNLITLIKTKQRELEKLIERQDVNKGSFDEQIAAVELAFKFQIDEHKTTVKRFFNYINILTKQDKNGRR